MESIARETDEYRALHKYVKLLGELHYDIRRHNGRGLSKLKEIIELQDISCKTLSNGCTVLHFVVSKYDGSDGDLSFIEFLISQGADLTSTNEKCQTVIHWIVSQHQNDLQTKSRLIKFILKTIHLQNGNPTNFQDIHGLSHFHVACMLNDTKIIEFFLAKQVSLDEALSMNSPIFPGYTPLHIAVEYGYLDLVDKLLNLGVSLLKNSKEETVLHMLIARNMKISQFVTLHRFLKGERSEYEWSPCEESMLEKMETNEKLITSILRKIDETTIDNVGLLPFYVMRTFKDTSPTQIDISKSIDVNLPFWPKYTALHFAACFSFDIVKSLIEKGADIEAKDVNGVTALDLCVGRYSIEDIHSIISSHSIWKNIRLSDGKTKLLDLVLVMAKPKDIVSFLLEIQQGINAISIPSDSPLWPGFSILHLALALSKKHMRCRIAYAPLFYEDFVMSESYLLQITHPRFGRLDNLSDEDVIRKPNELTQVCLSLGGDVVARDNYGSTPIHLAFRRLDLENLYFLLDRCNGKDNHMDNDNLSLLHIACASENVNLVKRLLAYSSSADINAAVSSSFDWDHELKYFHNLSSVQTMQFYVWPGSTPLHIALPLNEEVSELLIKAGADLEAKDINGFTPLHCLIIGSTNVDICADAVLAEFISKDNVVDGLSYLHIASFRKYLKLMDKLLDLGVDVNAKISSRADHQQRHYEEKVFLDKTANLSDFFSYFEGSTPLHMALERCFKSRDYDIVKALISRGADVLAKNSKGDIPLLILLKNNRYKCLLTHFMYAMNDTIEKCIFDFMGLTKLHLATRLCDVKIIQECVNNGVDVNAQIRNDSSIWPGFTALHLLVKFFDHYLENKREHEKEICEATQILLDAGVDLTIANAKGETPLLLDIIVNHIESRPQHINMLWETWKMSMTNINPVSLQGISHFHVACIRNDVAVVEKFLKLGVDPNQSVDYLSDDYACYTALHFSVRRRTRMFRYDWPRPTTIKLLLQHGANVHAKDIHDITPLDLAVKFPSPGALPYKRMSRVTRLIIVTARETWPIFCSICERVCHLLCCIFCLPIGCCLSGLTRAYRGIRNRNVKRQRKMMTWRESDSDVVIF